MTATAPSPAARSSSHQSPGQYRSPIKSFAGLASASPSIPPPALSSPSGASSIELVRLAALATQEEDELDDDDSLNGPSTQTVSSQTLSQDPKGNGHIADDINVVQERKAVRGIGYGTGAGKSRKSSCVNCHHRKIKCDQQRPCNNCAAKGQDCKYLEEHEQYAHHIPLRVPLQPRPAAVDPRDPASQHLMPDPNAHNSDPPSRLGYRMGSLQEWKVDSSSTSRMGESSRDATPVKSDKKKKTKHEIREKIMSGFDTDSDDDTPQSDRSRSVEKKSVEKKDTPRSVDGELAALVEDEVDELEDDDDRHGDGGSNKRSVSVDDDISGELLELASAPPKKKKRLSEKPVMAPPPPQQAIPPAQYMLQQQRSGKMVTPLMIQRPIPAVIQQSLPPTPGTGINITHGAPASRANSSSGMSSDPYSVTLQSLSSALPSAEMHSILFTTFFTDPFLSEGISLLQIQFMDSFNRFMDRRSTKLHRGDATTLALTFIFLASALRILPEETGRLLLATQGAAGNLSQIPRPLSRILSGMPAAISDTTPLDQRYLDLALLACQVAEQSDPHTILLVVFKLILYRYSTMGHRKDKTILAGSWLAQGIKFAQSLGMGKEWGGLPQGDRELRRRVMWSLYVADRHYSFETAFPYSILDAHQGIHLPSCLSESDLYKVPAEARELPPYAINAPPTPSTVLHIHTHLARRITPMLDSFATISVAHVSHEHILRFDQILDNFQDTLPPCFKVSPMTETRYDTTLPFLPVQRLRLHATLFAYRSGIHRTHLPHYLNPITPAAVRQVISQICLSSLRIQRSTKLLDPKIAFRLFDPITVFENAATLGLVLYTDRAVLADAGLPKTTDYVNNRQGMADALELLDMAGMAPGVEGLFAKKATVVIRGLAAQVDSSLEPAVMVKTPVARTNGDVSSPAINIGPETIDSILIPDDPSMVASPSVSVHSTLAAKVTTPVAAGTPSALPQVQAPEMVMGAHSKRVALWLDSLLHGGLNMEVLLREAEWLNGWERVISIM